MEHPIVKMHLLPGGIMPKRQTKEAAGYDAHLRAIVSPHGEMDPNNPVLRKTLFDFKKMPSTPDVDRHIQLERNDGTEELVYLMDPGESVLGGVGFVTAMDFPMFLWIAPRGGLSSRWGITVTNAPGTVDADYRGEAGVLIFNRNNHPFKLRYGMRIAQVIFQMALIPEIKMVNEYQELDSTDRGLGAFGSTGLR